MTILSYREMRCAICKKKSKQAKAFLSLHTSISPYELDFKPFNIPITFELKCRFCPHCGYAAPDIRKKLENAEIVMKKRKYKMQANNKKFPQTANALMCYSIYLEYHKKYGEAALHSLEAAWVCENEEKINLSKICRKRFLSLFKKAKEKGQKVFMNEIVEDAIIIDALRRIRHFKEALKKDYGKDNNSGKKLIKFQIELIKKKDSKIHEMEEVKFWKRCPLPYSYDYVFNVYTRRSLFMAKKLKELKEKGYSRKKIIEYLENFVKEEKKLLKKKSLEELY